MGYKLINTSPKKVTKYLFIYFKVLFCQKSVIKFKNACYTNPHIHCMDNSSGPHLKAWCCNRMATIARQPGEFFPPKYSTISYMQYYKVEVFRYHRKQATKSQTI